MLPLAWQLPVCFFVIIVTQKSAQASEEGMRSITGFVLLDKYIGWRLFVLNQLINPTGVVLNALEGQMLLSRVMMCQHAD